MNYLIISHGHNDHGGGLKAFLRENSRAEVFIHHLAFEKHYARCPDEQVELIGIDEELKENKQIIQTSDRFFIYKGIQVFSNITQQEPLPSSNCGLLMEENGQLVNDIFNHEQNLIVEEEGKTFLVTGCAHNGIINIIEHFHTLKGCMPDYVIGGFHLSDHSGGNENLENIKKIANYLMKTKAKYFTCHCTGIEPYYRLKALMGENIDYIKSGSVIEI